MSTKQSIFALFIQHLHELVDEFETAANTGLQFAAKALPVATQVAEVAEAVTGNAALIPVTAAAGAAAQTAVAATEAVTAAPDAVAAVTALPTAVASVAALTQVVRPSAVPIGSGEVAVPTASQAAR